MAAAAKTMRGLGTGGPQAEKATQPAKPSKLKLREFFRHPEHQGICLTLLVNRAQH